MNRKFCLACQRRVVRGSNFLCYDCKAQDDQKDKEALELQGGREFKLELHELTPTLPALRCAR